MLLDAQIDVIKRAIAEVVSFKRDPGPQVRAVRTPAILVGVGAEAGVYGRTREKPDCAGNVKAVRQEKHRTGYELMAPIELRSPILGMKVESVFIARSASIALVVVIRERLRKRIKHVELSPTALELGS